jgi:hypothetical protein
MLAAEAPPQISEAMAARRLRCQNRAAISRNEPAMAQSRTT